MNVPVTFIAPRVSNLVETVQANFAPHTFIPKSAPALLTPQQLHDYQKECVYHQLYFPDSMLWLQMGLGKTVITLTTIVDRMRAGQVKKVLIFGPLRVIQAVWEREARKWTHTKHLRFSVLHGTREKRTRALFADADVFLCNYEAMNWLAQELDHYFLSQGHPLPMQMVVYDEVSKLKNSTAKRMAGGRRDKRDKRGDSYVQKLTGWRKVVDEFQFRIGLTGTPAPNGYIDLHGQYLAVDGGERLGEYITHFRDSYFANRDGHGWKYEPTEIGRQWIEHKISDITKKMDAKDYLDMPAVKVVNMMVTMPDRVREHYRELEKKLFTQLDTGIELELFNKASLSNKCLQFCNGMAYHTGADREFDKSGYEKLHDEKLDALEEVLDEAGGQPVLCSYSFISDAERIMERFKAYKPVNLTATKSAATGKVIDNWNAGKIKLLIGHPKCLHPSTQVLTELRGWVRLIDVTKDDRVFDGIEFVSHDGCSYSGHKEVTTVFGVTMTPDHKLMIDGKWCEARDVRTNQESKAKALYQYKGNDPRVGALFALQQAVNDGSTELPETQQDEPTALHALYRRDLSPDDQHSYMASLARVDMAIERLNGQKLRRTWDQCVRTMGGLQEFLRGHARRLCRSLNDRAQGCEQELLQKQLHVGNDVRTTGEQAHDTQAQLHGHRDAPCRVVSSHRGQQDDAVDAFESRHDSRRSGGECVGVTLRERSEGEEKAHVYDLVNCGPRHRFVIRNDDGEAFISHNSMGHGIDGLQQAGNIVVWFGLCWSYEDYEQMNSRINRQGQTRPVSIIRILCNDSVDLAVADALERKQDDQEGLKAAIDRYRKGYTTNDLAVNFY
jgi:hypothetical protein